MVILLSSVLLIWFFSSLKDKNNDLTKQNKTFLILSGIVLILVAGLRSRYIGTTDTNIYCGMFEGMDYYSSFESFYTSQGRASETFLLSERAFYLFAWLLGKISGNAQWLIFATSFVNIFCALYFIKHNSPNTAVSVIAFACLGSLTFSMNGMRQALAMSICLLSFEFVKKRKIVWFLLTVLLAILFHKTAVVFVIVYFIYGMKWNFKNISLITVAFAAFCAYAGEFAGMFDEVTGKDYADETSIESGGYVTLLIYLLCIAAALLNKRLDKSDPMVKTSLLLSIFGMLLYSARYFSTQIYERVSYFFFFFVLILLAYVIESMSKNKALLQTVVIALAIALFAYRLHGSAFHNYQFFF